MNAESTDSPDRRAASRGASLAAMLAAAALAVPLAAQTAQDISPRVIDECGVLVREAGCVLFEGAGGRYYIPEPGRYREGDSVRVIGTLDPACITICAAADGCVRGAELYDPAVFPCGTELPSLANELLESACSGLSSVVSAGLLVSLWFLGRGQRRRVA